MWLTGPVAPWHVGSSQTRARTRVSCIGRQILNHCATREAPVKLFSDPSILKKKFRGADSTSWLSVLLAEFLGICFQYIVWNFGLRASLGWSPTHLPFFYLCSFLSNMSEIMMVDPVFHLITILGMSRLMVHEGLSLRNIKGLQYFWNAFRKWMCIMN